MFSSVRFIVLDGTCPVFGQDHLSLSFHALEKKVNAQHIWAVPTVLFVKHTVAQSRVLSWECWLGCTTLTRLGFSSLKITCRTC